MGVYPHATDYLYQSKFDDTYECRLHVDAEKWRVSAYTYSSGTSSVIVSNAVANTIVIKINRQDGYSASVEFMPFGYELESDLKVEHSKIHRLWWEAGIMRLAKNDVPIAIHSTPNEKYDREIPAKHAKKLANNLINYGLSADSKQLFRESCQFIDDDEGTSVVGIGFQEITLEYYKSLCVTEYSVNTTNDFFYRIYMRPNVVANLTMWSTNFDMQLPSVEEAFLLSKSLSVEVSKCIARRAGIPILRSY